MGGFFERFEQGQYDMPVLILAGMMFIAISVWHDYRVRLAKLAFFAAQDIAREAHQRMGAENAETQRCVLEALNKWQTWQRRPVPDIASDSASSVEWHAISLLQSLPDKPDQYVM